MPITAEIVRDLIRNELLALGLIPSPKPAERIGLPVHFSCSCPRERCQELRVAPTRGASGEKWVNLQIMGGGGVILDQEQRDALAALLLDRDWYGDRADLGV